MKFYREQNDRSIREIFDLKNEIYNVKKPQKLLKESLEAKTKDYKRIQEEYSVKCVHLRVATEKLEKLTAELDALKAKFQDAEFNFKKFNVSSAVVENMIEKQLKWKSKQVEGLGYSNVPPPYNDNYSPNLDYDECIKNEKSGTNEDVRVNDSNASTSCADEVIVEDWTEKDDCDHSFVDSSKTNNLLSSVSSSCLKNDVKPVKTFVPLKTCGNVVLNASSKNRTFEKVKPQDFVRQSKCTCSCDCGSSSSQNSFGHGPSPNFFYLKKQTCFNCGIPGHIARNCPNRSYVPYYEQGWKNVPRGRSSKRNPSRSRSRDGDWNASKKAKQQTHMNKKDMTTQNPDSRDAFIKPTWVMSKSSQGSSYSSHLNNKPKAKGVQNSKSSVESPVRLNHNKFKPNYRWVPKVSLPKVPISNMSKSPVNSVCSLSDKQDMVWEKVACVDANGQPSFQMDWVPKTN